MRQSRARGCNSRTGDAAAAAGGDPCSTQRPRQSHVGDQNKTRPRGRRDKETTAPETTRRAAAPAAAPPPPPPLPPPPPPLPRPRSPSISSWRAIFAEDYGHFYFYNPNTGETTWEPPRKSRVVRGVMAQKPVVNRNIGAERGAVTVRSRSLVTLLKGGKLECRAGSAVSLRSDGGKRPNAFPPRKEELQGATIDAAGRRDNTRESRTSNRTNARSAEQLQLASARAIEPISRKVAGTRKDVPEQQSRAGQKKPLEKGRGDTKRALRGKRTGTTHPEETTRCGKAEACCPRNQRTTLPLKSESSEPSSRATRVATSLLRAENWLAQNEPEVELERPRSRTLTPDRTRPRPKSSREARRPSARPVGSCGERVQADTPHRVEGSGPMTTARLRGRAAAVWASIQAQRREEEEMTGKPEITRLGRSKQRSIDDLFLFQRKVEDCRRRKRDQREAHENKLVTGRPETCGRSASLVKQMRRHGAYKAHLSTSKRLYGDAREQRRRQETLQMQVDTAIRRRANPTLSVRSRSLPRDRSRGDAARRLYDQAIATRDEALQRERCVAQSLPRGVTFHPDIHQRSKLLAQRRRERWASATGLGVPGSETGSVATADAAGTAAVQEFLLAEGALYDRRRRERQLRQEELALRSKSPAVNRHSRRLLRKAERMGRSLGTQAETRVPEDVVADVDLAGGHDFSPRLEALDTSKRMLESRYGRGSIPSMEQRSIQRERERLEKEAQLNERNKENRTFVARRIARPRPENGDPEHFRGAGIYERTKEYIKQKETRWASEREALVAEELADCTFAPEFRTKCRGRSRYRQRASNGPNSSLAGEVSDVVRDEGVVPAASTIEMGGSASRSAGSSGCNDNGGGSRRSGPLRDRKELSGLPMRRRRRPKQQTAIEDEGSGVGPFAFCGEEEVIENAGGIGRSGDYSVGLGGGRVPRSDSDGARGRATEDTRSLSALLSRRPSGGLGCDGHSSAQEDYSVYESTEDGSDHFLLRTGDTVATAPSASARNDGSRRSSTSGRAVTAVTREDTPSDDDSAASPLPCGWTAFTSPEGWAYFFNEETSAVQWKRPTR